MKTISTVLALALSASLAMPVTAQNYRGRDVRERCKKSSGTTGAVAGAVGGGVAGHVLGGGTLGTLAGAGGGALLGRHLDKKHDAAQNRRNGC